MTHRLEETNTDINTNQDCRLSVQIALTGLSFLKTDAEGKVLDLNERHFDQARTPEELLFELAAVLDQPEWNRSYTQVDLIYATDTATVVPSPLFNPNKSSEYLKFNTRILDGDFVEFDRIEALDLVVVHVPFVNINNYIFDRCGSFSYYHATTLLLGQLVPVSRQQDGPKAYVHVLPELFHCILMDKGKVMLVNQFRYQTPEDFLYYLLFCFEQQQLDPNTVETVLMGAVEMDDPLYEIAYRYIRNLSMYDEGTQQWEGYQPQQHILFKSL